MRPAMSGELRVFLPILALAVAGCGSVSPTPIVIYVTPAPTPIATSSSAEPSATLPPSPTASPTPSPTPSPAPTVARPTLSPKVAGASTTRYYSVTGNSPPELLLGLSTNCLAQSWLCADTSFGYEYTTSTNVGTGYCSVTKATVSFKPIARVPRWTGPPEVYPDMISWWQQVLNHIISGEAALITIQRTANARFATLLVGHPCSAAKGIISKWEASTTTAANAFYKKDATWQVPFYSGP